jgi:hypothetical protein
MSKNKKTALSVFSNQLGPYSQAFLNSKIPTNVPTNLNKITSQQNQILLQIKTNYTNHLKNANYKDVSPDIGIYFYLLDAVKKMIQIEPGNNAYVLLLEICMKALTGSLNMYTIYERIRLDEATIIRLTLNMNEILSNKNMKSTINTVKGNYAIKKTIQLSSTYSNYINYYGFPAFGEGFDVDKLNFLKTYNL